MATVTAIANPPTSPDDRVIEAARQLLGVSKYSSKMFIKRTAWEEYRLSAEDRRTREAARRILLKHYVLDSSAEAKRVRAQEEADRETRQTFRSQLYGTERAQELVPDKELAAVREVLRDVYETLPTNQRMSFIRIAGNVFKLTPKEKKALDKQEAEGRARWQAQQAKKKVRKNALDAYYKETNPTKKKALWKAYLDLTKEERQAKAAAKKAEQTKIANALATVEQQKIDKPELWGTAVATAAKVVIGQALGRYVWDARLSSDDYMPGYWSWSYGRKADPSNQERIQWVTMALAGVVAKHHLTKKVLDEIAPNNLSNVGERSEITGDAITGDAITGNDEVTRKASDKVEIEPEFAFNVDAQLVQILEDVPGVDATEALEELLNYAALLVSTYWQAIVEIGTYLLAVREIDSRTLTKLRRKTVGEHWNKPAFQFSPTMASAMLAALER